MTEASLAQNPQREVSVEQGAYALFLDAVGRVEAGQADLVELVTFARNPVMGEHSIYSDLAGRVADPAGSAYSERDLNKALTQIVAELTGDANGRQDLTGHLRERPDYRGGEDDYDFGFGTQFHEWPAATRKCYLGVKSVVSDRGVLQRTWYVAGSTVRERSLSSNRLVRGLQLWLNPELLEPEEPVYHPSGDDLF